MNRLTVICIAIAMFTAMSVNAQKIEKADKWQKVTIQTNGSCHTVKDKIEKGLAYEKGVKDVVYDATTSKVQITYDSGKTNVQNLKDAIVKLGYKVDVAPAKSCSKTCNKPCGTKTETKPACSGHDHK
jgi:copper chaperone CopZ